MSKITVIVPTYNVEAYIEKCLISLVNQDFDDYNIYVVNDGSPANEKPIILRYVDKYPDKVVFIDKENGGYGSVLELAIAKTDSEYILICDPDDYLDESCLSTLYKKMTENDLDLVVGAKYLVYSDNDEVVYDKSFNADFGTLDPNKVYEKGSKEFESLYFLEPSPHAKLYKREIVKDIVFPHKISYTDNLLYFYTLSRVKRVMYCEKALAYYLINRVGNTRTDVNPNKIDAFVKVFKSVLDQTPEADDIFYYRVFESAFTIFYMVEQVKGENDVKADKYALTYELFEKLLPYGDRIIRKYQEYTTDNNVVRNQKIAVLKADSSRSAYQQLVDRKLNGGSFKHRLRLFLTRNALINKLYERYYEKAKYKTRDPRDLILNPDVELKQIDPEGVNFFGYFDKPAIRNGHVIYHKMDHDGFDLSRPVDICLDGVKISESNTYNLQQGAMLSWLDDEHIIHNFFDGSYKAKIIDIRSREERIIDFPIYSLSSDGSFALSLDFRRLAKLRPDYGYFNIPYQDIDKVSDKEGIYYVDLVKNTHELILSLEEVAEFESKPSMKDAFHKVNHITVSPDNDKAIFLHRWYDQANVKHTRLLVMDIRTRALKVLADNEMVSHIAWVNNDLLFGYLKGSDDKDAYYYIDMDGNQKRFDHRLLIDDGHPTVYNERYIVTDSYPDSNCRSKLMLIDTENKDVTVLGEFFSPYEYRGERRCDLHPRFDHQKKSLTFDSVYTGKRHIYSLDLSKLIKDQRD